MTSKKGKKKEEEAAKPVKKKKEQTDEKLEGVENLLTRTERYIEENQKSLTFIVVAIIVVVLGYMGYRHLYVAPLEKEAVSEMYSAERYFEIDSFSLALYGDGNQPGFLDIIDEYGVTKTANLASYYAGLSFLHLGEYENAIEYLSRFHSRDQFLSAIAIGAMGDAYLELGEYESAASFYSKAAQRRDNNLTTPIYLMKAGLVYEELENYEKSLEMYNRILENYPDTQEGAEARKYIGRVKARLNQ